MFNFDGSFRRNPIQNLAGSSIETDRISLIEKARDERRRREETRQKQNSSLKIQSAIRSFIIRSRVKRSQRQIFDNYVIQQGLNNEKDLEFLLKRLIFFYDDQIDSGKLISISQFILKNLPSFCCNLLFSSGSEQLNEQWQFRTIKILVLCQKQMLSLKTSTAIPMRILETFTSLESLEKCVDQKVNRMTVIQFLRKCFNCLVKQSFFKTMKTFLENRIPAHAYEFETTAPHNEVSRLALDMIIRPLNLVNFIGTEKFRSRIISYFIREILIEDFDATTSNFIVPSLAINAQFPYAHFLKTINSVLERTDSKFPVDDKKRLADELKTGGFNVFLLYSVVKLSVNKFEDILMQNCANEYFHVIGKLLDYSVRQGNFKEIFDLDTVQDSSSSDSESDFDDMDVDEDRIAVNENSILRQTINLLNESDNPEKFVKLIEQILCGKDTVRSFCLAIHNMIILQRNSAVENRIIGLIAYKPEVLRTLWYNLLTASTRGDNKLCISILSKGMIIGHEDRDKVLPILVTFCTLFGKLLTTLHDGEFFYCHFNNDENQSAYTCDSNVEPIENQVMPFHRTEMIHMCLTLKELCVGLVELVYPESRTALTRRIFNCENEDDLMTIDDRAIWSQLLKNCVALLRQLHSRDLRCNFCPKDHWIAQNLNLPLDRPSDLQVSLSSRRREVRSFQPVRDFTRKNQDDEPPLSTKQLRSITILREIPFVVPFNKRFEVLQGLIATEKFRCQGDTQGFLQGPQTHLNVRRTHLYEDSFDKLSPENEPNLRTKFRVQMINRHQLEEAGIDGGGIFREFLSELIKQSFDPNRGFFILTKDNLLYPNPCASLIQQNYLQHYYFIGRMLGKAIFENLLVELPLAEFFLWRLAGRNTDIDIDVHLLATLDPDMHKNLMKLKNYDENDFKNLGLDFTVVCDYLGETKVVELKPDGANIPVNSSNWIEYVSAMTDFKLNRQIKQQCNAFRQGLSNVVPISWLYMFDVKEMQTLISGAEVPIDVDDLMKNTKYGGDYTPDHKTVKTFWKVFREFDDNQRRQLLRFVTSCSRPPLLGFKDLDPPFCIQAAGDDLTRLVTASTCLNLLKLPEYKDEKILKEKLLYAIQSGVGFELS